MGLRVIRTHASEIEPWLLIVDYVSPISYSVCKIYNASEFNIDIVDKYDEKITDVLPLHTLTNESLKMYYGYIFTRNPYLYITAQEFALVTITFVHILEQVFIQRTDYNYVNHMINVAYTLSDKIKCMLRKNDVICIAINNMIHNDSIEKYFTENHGIASICMILGGLLLDEASILFTQKYNMLSFGLMAESVTRSCRGYLRSGSKNYNQHIQHVLGIDETNVDNYVINVDRAKKLTGRFYMTRYTNCSPFALVSTLEFIERYHKQYSHTKIARAYMRNKINMKRFLRMHLPEHDGITTQIALFIQGVRYHKSRQRQNIHFTNPTSIINEAIEEQRNIILRKRELLSLRENKRSLKKMRLVQLAEKYMLAHSGCPTIFTHTEVNEMNARTIDSDNDEHYELTQSGLLKHHCCYPDCPEYLQNFATISDIKNGTRRGGLYRHFKYDMLVLDTYVPSFHLVGKMKCRSTTNFNEFVELMDEYYNHNDSMNIWYKKLHNKEKHLKNMWRIYNN